MASLGLSYSATTLAGFLAVRCRPRNSAAGFFGAQCWAPRVGREAE